MRTLLQEQPQGAPPASDAGAAATPDAGAAASPPVQDVPVAGAPTEETGSAVLAWLGEYWWFPLLVVLLVLLVIGIVWFVRRAKAKSKPPAAEPDAPADVADDTPDKKDPDVIGIHDAFRQHEQRLKEYVPGGQFRYQLPWYLMVGEEGAGKTTVLETLYQREDLPLLIGVTAQQRRRNVHWWYFQDAVVLDVPGNYVLASSADATRHMLWKSVLRQLQARRRRRPLDGIILTVPCTDFYGPTAPSAEELEHKADQIYQKFLVAQRVLGLRFPLYLLVTKSDCIPSFDGYLRELPDRFLDAIFGWSSPYSLETAFTPTWVEEAFDAMGQVLRRSQVELLSDGIDSDDPDNFFVFPSDFDEIREPVSHFLTRLLRPSAYHDAFDLRGIFFTGDGGRMPEPEQLLVPTQEPEVLIDADGTGHTLVIYDRDPFEPDAAAGQLVRPGEMAGDGVEGAFLEDQPRPVFLKQLFQEKVFPEYRLARPLTQRLRYGHRTARLFQIASIIVAVLWSAGLIFSYTRLSEGGAGRVQTLQTIRDGVLALREAPNLTGADQIDDQLVRKLLNNFSALDGRTLRSVFIPASWFSSINDSLEWSFKTAYEDFVFPSIQMTLGQRADSLIRAGYDVPIEAFIGLGSDFVEAGPVPDDPAAALTERSNRLLARADSLERRANALRLQGNALIEQGSEVQAESLFTVMDRHYTESAALYDEVDALFEQVGRPAPSPSSRSFRSNAAQRSAPVAGSQPLAFREQLAFRRLQRYVERLVELEGYAQRYNGVKATESLEDLEGIIEYLYRSELPAGFQRHTQLYGDALGRVDFTGLRFTIGEARQASADRAAISLVDELYTDLFEGNALYGSLEELTVMLDYLDGIEQRIRARANESQIQMELQEGLTAIREVRLLLDNRALSYLSPSSDPYQFLRLDSLDVAFYDVVNAMRRSDFFGEAPISYMVSQGIAKREEARAALLGARSSLTGSLLAVDPQTQQLMLSPAVEALEGRLARLNDLAALEERGGIRPPIPGFGLQWNVELLRTAADLDLSNFIDQAEDGAAQDSYFSGAHFEAAIVDLVRRATIVKTADDAAFLLSHPNLLQEAVQNFASASEFVTRILNKLQAVKADKNRRDLENLATQQARFLLSIVDRLREQKRLYTLSVPTTLEPGQPLYIPILNASSNEEVEAYLETQRAEVQNLALGMAAPLVLFLENTRATQDEATARRVALWQNIVRQVQDYEQKQPGNTLSALEAFLRGVLNATSAEECLAVAETLTVRGSGYFAERYSANRAVLSTKCRGEAIRNARLEYQTLARYFNEFLGGRAPFIASAGAVTDQADPDRLRIFLQRYRKFMSVSGDVVRRTLEVAGTSPFERPWPFLQEVGTVDSLFSAFVTGDDAARPEFDVEVEFRVQPDREPVGSDGIPLGSHIISWELQLGNRAINRNDENQTGRWVFGEPARLSLRWAKDGPRIPLHDPGQPGLLVGQERRTTFAALGGWGLLTLLNRHRRPSRSAYPDAALLEFSIPTQNVNSSAIEKTTVYVQVRLKPLGSNEALAYPPSFPTRAPALD